MSKLKTVGKWALAGVAGLLAMILILVLLGLGYRAYRMRENAKMLVIHSPNGIARSGFIRINGVEQWVQIRGEDRDNPVILFLHGGPGYSAIPITYATMKPWEHYFTIVHWDQRGSGKTYLRNHRQRQVGNSIQKMVADAIRVAEFARTALRKDKLIIVGHSWGSILGAELVRQRPDLFYAYVGTGQVVNVPENEKASYAGLFARVQAAGDRGAEAKLRSIGAPPYKSPVQLSQERDVLADFPAPREPHWGRDEKLNILFAPGYSLADDYYVTDAQDLEGTLFKQVFAYDILANGNEFNVPMFFFQGADDLTTPASLVRGLLPAIRAPLKEAVFFTGGGHNSVNICREFLEQLVRRVRPLATGAKVEAAAYPPIVESGCTPKP
jgi:pimeloyl-ACP methyl ester carboxylesterase